MTESVFFNALAAVSAYDKLKILFTLLFEMIGADFEIPKLLAKLAMLVGLIEDDVLGFMPELKDTSKFELLKALILLKLSNAVKLSVDHFY